jgi:uncharacterized protein with NAD-binding domain and iron-sulfur cluster
LLSPAAARAAGRPSRPSVAVLGGGMGGLAAAHELIERGFDVTVYERKALGGKARSIASGLPTLGGRRELPGEHGFRFFPGFYHHVPDTMRRIPFPGNAGGVHDNLVDAPMVVISLVGQEDIAVPFGFTAETPGALTPQLLSETLVGGMKVGSKVPPQELAVFVQRLMVFLTSCDERRYGQWEHTSWMEFVKAEGKSPAYRHLLASGLTRALVAAKEEVASSRTIGNMAEAFVMNLFNRGNDGAPDRVLNAPTNEAWIDPWVAYLQGRGVRFRVGHMIESLRVADGRIVAAGARDRRGRHRRIEADWFISAMPAERAARLWNRKVLALDPALARVNDLKVDWMNGIQFYLTRDAPLVAGHMAYMDTPWSLTSINQAQFWTGRSLSREYGDGRVQDILSVDISDWDTPGILYGKPAKQCAPEEVAKETWAQIKASVNDTRSGALRDADLHSWFLDPGISWNPKTGRNHNDDPLLVNTVGSWDNRPTAATKVPNLFLAADYVRTNIDLATMEGANEAARTAVNALLDASGSKAERARMYTLLRSAEFEAAKQVDSRRYRAGQPNALDTA